MQLTTLFVAEMREHEHVKTPQCRQSWQDKGMTPWTWIGNLRMMQTWSQSWQASFVECLANMSPRIFCVTELQTLIARFDLQSTWECTSNLIDAGCRCLNITWQYLFDVWFLVFPLVTLPQEMPWRHQLSEQLWLECCSMSCPFQPTMGFSTNYGWMGCCQVMLFGIQSCYHEFNWLFDWLTI